MPPPERGSPLNDVALGYIPQQSSDFYPRRLTLTDIDYRDTRYPNLASPKYISSPQPLSSPSTALPYPNTDHLGPMTDNATRTSWVDYPHIQNPTFSPTNWLSQNLSEEPNEQPPLDPSSPFKPSPDLLIIQDQPSDRILNPTLQFTHQPPTNAPSFALDPRDDRFQSSSLNNSGSPLDPNRIISDFASPSPPVNMGQRSSGPIDLSRDRPASLAPTTSRQPSSPLAAVAQPSSPSLPPIVPLSAGPSFNPSSMAIPISPNPRAYAQQPTFINPSSTQPSFAPPQVPKEEVCVECAMRDQDMADVDVTSRGIWERESDALYEDLLQREEEEELAGLPPIESASRPKARGGLLTETNLRLWLSVVSHSHLVTFHWSKRTFELNNMVNIRTRRNLHLDNRRWTSTSRLSAGSLRPKL